MRLLAGATATRDLGREMAQHCQPPLIIYLNGELGSGKTTFAQGFIRAFGYAGIVKSPTFSLLEIYEFEGVTLYHFDLYRLQDVRELEYIGIRETSSERDAICLVEWPQRGRGAIPAADLTFNFQHHGGQRKVSCHAQSTSGRKVLTSTPGSHQREGGPGN